MRLSDGTSNDYSQWGHFLTLLGMENNEIFVGDPGGSGRSGYTSMNNIKNSGPKRYFLVDKK